jgi:hypothetical protein
VRCRFQPKWFTTVRYVMPLLFPLFGEDPSVGLGTESAPPETAERARSEAERARTAFVSGLKAAFLVSQLNRLGQVLCGRCGRSWDDLTLAHAELTLARVVESGRGGYRGGLAWEDDHPNNVMLVCVGCLDFSTGPARSAEWQRLRRRRDRPVRPKEEERARPRRGGGRRT